MLPARSQSIPLKLNNKSTRPNHLRGIARWLALVDIDEFIGPMSDASVLNFLKEYEDYGGVYIRWEPFGTSHLTKLLRES